MARFEFAMQEFWGFVLVLVRTGAILSAFPILGTAMVPVRVRVAVVVAISMVFGPMVMTNVEPGWLTPGKLSLGLMSELLIGLVLGFATRLLLAAVEVAGSIMGFQLGFGVAVQLDPVTQVETPVLASFLVILASLIYFVVDGHHLMLLALGTSFSLIPPLHAAANPQLMEQATGLMQHSFNLGLKLALPVIAVTFLTYLVLGIIGRVMPQMNVLFTGFPLTIGLGLLVLGFGLPLFAGIFQQTILGLETTLIKLMEEMGGG